MSHRDVISAIDSKKVSGSTIDNHLKQYINSDYNGVIYVSEKLGIIIPNFIQRKIRFSEISKKWIKNELSLKEYEILFITHASKINLLFKIKLIYLRKCKIRFVNFVGDFYLPTKGRSKWASFLVKGVIVLIVLPGLIFYLPTVGKVFWFVKKNKIKI